MASLLQCRAEFVSLVYGAGDEINKTDEELSEDLGSFVTTRRWGIGDRVIAVCLAQAIASLWLKGLCFTYPLCLLCFPLLVYLKRTTPPLRYPNKQRIVKL